jgi:hypothetical protein
MYIQDKMEEYADEIFDRLSKVRSVGFCAGLVPGEGGGVGCRSVLGGWPFFSLSCVVLSVSMAGWLAG